MSNFRSVQTYKLNFISQTLLKIMRTKAAVLVAFFFLFGLHGYINQFIIKRDIQMIKNSLKILNNKKDSSIVLMEEKPFFSVIWLHGLGDSSVGFLDYFQAASSPVFKGARVKLLQAPTNKVTINGGMFCNSWYDIKDLKFSGDDESKRYEMSQIKESLSIINKHVSQEIAFWKEKGIKQNQQQICKRIFVGGFSQGCAMSILYGLTSKRLLAGIIGYSGYLFQSFDLINKGKIPIIAYHGKEDSVIPFKSAQKSYETKFGQDKSLKFIPIDSMDHMVNLTQLKGTTQWIAQVNKKNDIK